MIDWKKLEKKTVSIGDLIRLARDLRDEDGDNVEYERALAELITDAAALSMEYKTDVANRIGLTCKVE